VHIFVTSYVDYCNALYAGAPKTDKLQRVLNATARVVSDTRKFDRSLTCQRVACKLDVMTYDCLHGQAPLGTSPTISLQPLTSLLGFVCVLQSDSSSSYLAVDSTHTAVGRFRSLPDELRDQARGSDSFKQFRKTILFSLY